MRTTLKRAVIYLYCHNRLSLRMTQKLFDLFGLKGF